MLISRAITNNMTTNLDLFVPGYNTIKPAVTIAPSTMVDLFTVLTGDELQAVQNQLVPLIAKGSITVNETVDTDTFNPIGGAAGITALTGNVTASGTGSVTATIANGVITPAMITTSGSANFTFPNNATVAGTTLHVGQSTTGDALVTIGGSSASTSQLTIQTENGAQGLIQIESASNSGWYFVMQGGASNRLDITDGQNNVILETLYQHGGVVLSPLSTTARHALTGVLGMVVYDTTLNKLTVYTGTTSGSDTGWEIVTSVAE